MSTSPKIWLRLALINLCMVALLGVIMRCKMVFDMPWIDYNHMVDTHGNFAFAGWITLALLTLILYQLPDSISNRKIYKWLLAGMVLCAWGTLFTGPFAKTHSITQYISFIHILLTYIFAWVFIRDTLKADLNKTVKLLSVSAIIYWVLSSAGPILLAWLFSTRSLNGILYRDALFGYLHLMYNGFFSLSVFAIAFQKMDKKMSDKTKATAYRFAVLLSLSVIPSMFLTFLWHDTNIVFHIVTIIACVLLALCALWFIFTMRSIMNLYSSVDPAIRILVFFSMLCFAIKLILQCLTIIHSINVMVFGNRPIIMGFLHMVFLAFVSLFILAYLAQTGIVDTGKRSVRFALYLFLVGINLNQSFLMAQGLATVLIVGNKMFSWLLLGAGTLLLAGALLIASSKSLWKAKYGTL